MKVTGVRVTPYSYRLARRRGKAQTLNGTLTASGCVIELLTDVGLSGYAIGVDGAGAVIERLGKDLVIGIDPRAVTGTWERGRESHSASGAPFNEALAALDIALWDLKAKANDEPLWKALGGARPRATVHASGVDMTLSDEELSGWYVAMARDYGVRAGKLQVGLDQDADLKRLALVRAALLHSTSDPALTVDADQCWSPKEAIRKLREMEERFDLTCAEGVCRSWDFPGVKQVSNAIRGAVGVGEHLAGLEAFLPHFHHRSADVIQVDIAVHGITGALQLADAAFGYELPVTLCASPGNIQAHLAPVMPYFMSMEVVDPVPATRIYATDVRIEQGWAIAGDAPGHGLAVDRDALTAAATRVGN